MAAVTRVKARNCTVVGYEVNDTCQLAVDVVAGDQLTFSGALSGGVPIMTKAPITGVTEAAGIALQDGYAGQSGFSYGVHGEMDGFSGMTPGAVLYPSTVTVGGLDTTPIAGATERVRAVNATRIRFNYL